MKNMQLDTEETKVIFRKDRFDGETVAVFPAIAGDSNLWNCSAYVHQGQHCVVSDDYVRLRTRRAKPEEYAALKRELGLIGYRVRVALKMSRKD